MADLKKNPPPVESKRSAYRTRWCRSGNAGCSRHATIVRRVVDRDSKIGSPFDSSTTRPMKNYLTEFIGTFFLVLTIGLTVMQARSSRPRDRRVADHGVCGHVSRAVTTIPRSRWRRCAGASAGTPSREPTARCNAAAFAYRVLGKIAPMPGDGLRHALRESSHAALCCVVLNSAGRRRRKAIRSSGSRSASPSSLVRSRVAGFRRRIQPAVGIGPPIINATLGGGSWGALWTTSCPAGGCGGGKRV